MHRKALLQIVLLIITTPAVFSQEWQIAPAGASSGLEEASGMSFRPLDPLAGLDDYLIDSEGWFFLRTTITGQEQMSFLYFAGSRLYWKLWLNGQEISTGGTAPPYWSAAPMLPRRIRLAEEAFPLTVVVKVYTRRGYDEIPAMLFSESTKPVEDPLYLKLMLEGLSEYVGLVFALLLLIGGFFASLYRKEAWDRAMTLFGFFALFAFSESVLAWFPALARQFNWNLISITTTAALPLMLSFWRRSVGSAGSRDPRFLSIVDLLAATASAFWSILPMLPRSFGAFFPPYFLTTDPLPWYALWSAAIALVLWISRTAGRKSGRIGSFLILLAAMIPPVLMSFSGISARALYQAFIDFGMVGSLIVALPVMAARKAPVSRPSPSRDIQDVPGKLEDDRLNDAEDADEVFDLEEMEPGVFSPPAPAIGLPLSADSGNPASTALIRSLRSSLYPDSIPWDPRWELASTRQGHSHPSNGFYDIYPGSPDGLAGFSFMDTGSGSMESLIFANKVKSELYRDFSQSSALPKTARGVNRKSVSSAAAAGQVMNGVIGRFTDEGLAFLPLGEPQLMLRRADGRPVGLPARSAGNPALGEAGFGGNGLKTMSVSMSSGDAVIVYTPGLTEIRSADGSMWGRASLASALKDSRAKKPEGIISDILESLKDFAGTDELPQALQILVIRKR